MKKSTRIFLAACAVVGAVGPASANHSWNNYHWARISNPLTLRINMAVTGDWGGYVNTAVGQWNQSAVLAFTADSPKAVSVSRKQCNPIAGQILVCNDTYGQRGWLGIASIWLSSGHISQGTTKLNDTYFNMSRYNSPAWRAMVTCQEIGHDFGLAHQNEIFTNPNTGSCMDYTNDPTGKAGTNGTLANIAPNQHDYDQLATMYGHLDSSNTSVTAAAATNFGLREVGKAAPTVRNLPKEGSGDTAAEWGEAVHRDGKGRPDQFVRRFSDGTIMITHVLWAPDAKGTEAGPVHEDDGHAH
jgi:hypothetical protein